MESTLINDSLKYEADTSDFLFELPKEFGGTLEDSPQVAKDSLMAFDIKTGAQEA